MIHRLKGWSGFKQKPDQCHGFVTVLGVNGLAYGAISLDVLRLSYESRIRYRKSHA